MIGGTRLNKEIGSEFWDVELSDIITKTFQESRYFLSGRTAISGILKDLKFTKEIKSAYLPNYLCDSMLDPFRKLGMTVHFYNVDFVEGDFSISFDYNIKVDVILVMHYFGLNTKGYNELIDFYSRENTCIIEDSTHSWFSKNNYSKKSDYIFCSFRKWTGLACGAIALKLKSKFKYIENEYVNYEYISIREKAFKLKNQYINGLKGSDKSYLKLFELAEKQLEKNYYLSGVPIEYFDRINKLNYNFIKTRRRENVKYLIDELSSISGLIIPNCNSSNILLFIPVFVLNNLRDKLRTFLIKRNIYLPIHWPKIDDLDIGSDYIYENILSIVCDQRYYVNDLAYMIEMIKEFFYKITHE